MSLAGRPAQDAAPFPKVVLMSGGQAALMAFLTAHQSCASGIVLREATRPGHILDGVCQGCGVVEALGTSG